MRISSQLPVGPRSGLQLPHLCRIPCSCRLSKRLEDVRAVSASFGATGARSWAAAGPADSSDQRGSDGDREARASASAEAPDQTLCPLRSTLGSALGTPVRSGSQPSCPGSRNECGPSFLLRAPASSSTAVSARALRCPSPEPLPRPVLLPGTPPPAPYSSKFPLSIAI